MILHVSNPLSLKSSDRESTPFKKKKSNLCHSRTACSNRMMVKISSSPPNSSTTRMMTMERTRTIFRVAKTTQLVMSRAPTILTLGSSRPSTSIRRSTICSRMRVWSHARISTSVRRLWVAGPNLKVSKIVIITLYNTYVYVIVVEGLMEELDPNHSGDVNEEEFLLILKFI